MPLATDDHSGKKWWRKQAYPVKSGVNWTQRFYATALESRYRQSIVKYIEEGPVRAGICTEADMPYEQKLDASRQPSPTASADAKTRTVLGLRLHWIKEWDVKTGLTEEHFTGIKRTLASGWPNPYEAHIEASPAAIPVLGLAVDSLAIPQPVTLVKRPLPS